MSIKFLKSNSEEVNNLPFSQRGHLMVKMAEILFKILGIKAKIKINNEDDCDKSHMRKEYGVGFWIYPKKVIRRRRYTAMCNTFKFKD